MSNRIPLRLALGRKIVMTKKPLPCRKRVDVIHRKFYEEVLRVWDKYKGEFGYGDRTLTYVS